MVSRHNFKLRSLSVENGGTLNRLTRLSKRSPCKLATLNISGITCDARVGKNLASVVQAHESIQYLRLYMKRRTLSSEDTKPLLDAIESSKHLRTVHFEVRFHRKNFVKITDPDLAARLAQLASKSTSIERFRYKIWGIAEGTVEIPRARAAQ